MNLRSCSGLVEGSFCLLRRARSIIVSGRSDPSKWTCSSALGSRPISSRVSIGTPPGAHYHSENRAARKGRILLHLDPPSIRDVRRAAPEASRERWIVGRHGIVHSGAGSQIQYRRVHEHPDGAGHGRTNPWLGGTVIGCGSFRRYAISASTSSMPAGCDGRPASALNPAPPALRKSSVASVYVSPGRSFLPPVSSMPRIRFPAGRFGSKLTTAPERCAV